MNETTLPIHLLLAAAILVMDIVGAAIVFFSLQRREHALTYVIPPIILFTGILGAVAVFVTMNPSSN